MSNQSRSKVGYINKVIRIFSVSSFWSSKGKGVTIKRIIKMFIDKCDSRLIVLKRKLLLDQLMTINWIHRHFFLIKFLHLSQVKTSTKFFSVFTYKLIKAIDSRSSTDWYWKRNREKEKDAINGIPVWHIRKGQQLKGTIWD